MKQIKSFMVMLLSLVGMTATAQQPTLISSTAKPVTSSTLTTGKYLIAAGTSEGSYYFNVNAAKVKSPSTDQVFTCTKSGNKYYLHRNTNEYVYVNKSRYWFYYTYSLTTNSSSQSMMLRVCPKPNPTTGISTKLPW